VDLDNPMSYQELPHIPHPAHPDRRHAKSGLIPLKRP
jgi:hypothetical protein